MKNVTTHEDNFRSNNHEYACQEKFPHCRHKTCRVKQCLYRQPTCESTMPIRREPEILLSRDVCRQIIAIV